MRITYWTLGFLALFVLIAGTAAATHYRYGTLSWEPTENPNEVRFTGGQAWRGSAFGSPDVGQIVLAEGCLQTGESCINFYLKVNARSTINDWFSATFVDVNGNEGFTYTYSAPNNNGQPWQVLWGSCCRISQVSSGNYHVNNPDQSESLQTEVDLASGNASPRSTLPPINACPFEAVCTIPIPASDLDGDTMSYRMSSASEAGDPAYTPPGPPDAPNAATIDPVSGVLTWDTHGAAVGASNVHTLYSVQVMIEDGQTQTPLDFFIEILPVGVSPPYWVMPPTPCGQTLSVAADSELTFPVQAKSDGATRIVSVYHLGLPAGASVPPITPGNPASGTFTWTPTQAQAGQHLVVFAAEDDLGYPAPACPVTIDVNLHPPPTFTTPAACGVPATIHGIQGVPIGFPVVAQTINASRTVTISLVSGPAGLMFPTTAPANPTSGFATWSTPYSGAPAAVFRAVDNFGIRATCVVPFDIDAPMGQAFTLGVWAGSAVPAAIEYSSGGFDLRTVDADVPMRTKTIASIDHPQLQLHAEGIVEWARLDSGVGNMTAHAGNKIALVSLANGAVVLHGLEQEATITWDYSGATQQVTRTAHVDRIVVNGEDVPVPAGESVSVPLPGGYVSIFARSTTSNPGRVVLADDLVHIYLAPDYSRSEVILGSIILQGGLDLSYRQQAREILLHDDLRMGTDAGDGRATALALSVGAHDANMPGGDRADAYVFPAAHGEKVVFVAMPAPGEYFEGGSAVVGATPPPVVAPPGAATATLEGWEASLFDPTGALRETSIVVAGAPARVELNADITGQWLVILARNAATTATNYTLEVSITPVPLLPQNDALALGDAAPACVVGGAAIPLVGNGVWPGVVRDDDFADTYRFTAEIGEAVAATLKPGEDADGASMGLELYDRDCQLLDSMMTLTDILKGEPRVTLALPSMYSGDYYVRVVRLNGVANHYVDISVVNPQPTAPMNDALTGSDAPNDPAQAIAPPPLAFQGRIHEGDAGDAYRLGFNAGGTSFVGFSMSALSNVDVRLYAPGGAEVARYNGVGSTAVVWRFTPEVAGDYLLVVTPQFSGGNYAVTWGQLPVEQP